MRVAVIGAGLAGLSTSFYLSKNPKVEVTLFDPLGIGQGASGVATGLLHPFAGRKALRSWRSDEAMLIVEELLAASEEALGKPVCERTGIFRIAVTQQQQVDFKKRVDQDLDAKWLDHPLFGSGLWIPGGITVYTPLYLEGLWKVIQKRGVIFRKEKVVDLDSLQGYDQIVVSAGFETIDFPLLKDLPLKKTKGRTLLCAWDQRLPFSLVSQGHITPTADPFIGQIGATYEHFEDPVLSEQEVILELKRKVAQFYPAAMDWPVLDIRFGIRISRPLGYRPIIERIDRNIWVFTGLGSRGMLYHALLGKELASQL